MDSAKQSSERTFRKAFCEKYGCPEEAFEKRIFWQCLYRRSILLTWLIYIFSPKYFWWDFQAIRSLGSAQSEQEFLHAINRLWGLTQKGGSPLRNFFRVRLSGNKLIALRDEVLGQGSTLSEPANRNAVVG
jgi:hypothetical protein